jgi:hypothetical protein
MSNSTFIEKASLAFDAYANYFSLIAIYFMIGFFATTAVAHAAMTAQIFDVTGHVTSSSGGLLASLVMVGIIGAPQTTSAA